MLELKMSSCIVGAYDLSFETILDENDQCIYIVCYGAEKIETNDLEHAINYYDGCVLHQRELAGF